MNSHHGLLTKERAPREVPMIRPFELVLLVRKLPLYLGLLDRNDRLACM
jgi:hypothetical protein